MATDFIKQLLGHRAELLGYIHSVVRDYHAAEDLFQEMAAIIMKREREGVQVEKFVPWAKEIARREILHFYRDKRRKPLSLATEEMFDVASAAFAESQPTDGELADESEALQSCVEGLPAKSYQIIRDRFLRNVSYPEIAASLNCTEDVVRQTLSRIRRALFDCIQRKLRLQEEELA